MREAFTRQEENEPEPGRATEASLRRQPEESGGQSESPRRGA